MEKFVIQIFIESSKVAGSSAGAILDVVAETGEDCRSIADRIGVFITGTLDDVQSAVQSAILANAKAAADYRSGKQSAILSILAEIRISTANLL